MKFLILFGKGIVIVMTGIIIGLVVSNYNNNLFFEERLKEVENKLLDTQNKHYDFYNETRDKAGPHQNYLDSTFAALNSTDEMLALTLVEELYNIEMVLENLKEKHTSLVVLQEKLGSETTANAELIKEVKTQLGETAQTIAELFKELGDTQSKIYEHVSTKKGLFKKPHDKNVKNKMETN